MYDTCIYVMVGNKRALARMSRACILPLVKAMLFVVDKIARNMKTNQNKEVGQTHQHKNIKTRKQTRDMTRHEHGMDRRMIIHTHEQMLRMSMNYKRIDTIMRISMHMWA